MNEELDSQLSAMFDDELPTSECELLARRPVARRGAQGALGPLRGRRRGDPRRTRRTPERPARRARQCAHQVRARARRRRGAVAPRRARPGWWQPLAGAGLAAGVAAVSVLWLRAQAPLPGGALSARATPPVAVPVAKVADSYVVPPTPAVRPMVVPSTELANYVVAHSMVSSPVARRNLLSSFITSEPAAGSAEEPPEDAKAHAQ